MNLNCSKRTILAAVCSVLMLGAAPQAFAAGGKSPVPVPVVQQAKKITGTVSDQFGLVMFKECLRSGVVPFIITDELKMFYYRGLREWGHINGYLTDTCLSAQDNYKAILDYFRIKY